jgi:hypothetical protein
MNCENCQNLLSDWLDNELAASLRIDVGAHLSACPVCRAAHDQLDSILGFCENQRGLYDAVPNEEALWRRISNTIEAEQNTPLRASQPAPPLAWWQRLAQSWQVSRAQAVGSLAALVMAFSVMTVGMAKLPGAVRGLITSGASSSFAAAGNRLEHLAEARQPALDYWYQRVEQRKARWSPQIRQAFDYNLDILEQAAKESTEALRSNPQDVVSAERLSIVLEDKMELLKEFANR